MSRIISLILLVVSFILCTEASNVSIFGPKRYNRTTGKPNTYQDHFTLPQAATSPFILNVVNGAPNGSNRVSSGTIKINGTTIIKQSDFNQQVDTIRRTISLKSSNTIEVQLASAPNSYITITITGQGGMTIPVLSITQPTEGFITKTTPLSVAGTVSGTAPITVTANGSQMTVETNGVVSGLVTLVEGSNTVNFIAMDATGGSATVVRRVILDSQSPVVNLTSPIDNFLTNQATVTVHGTAMDSTSVTVTVNGAIVPMTNGSFSVPIALIEGLNTIAIVATDAAGNSTHIEKTVRKDTQSPILNLSSPADSLITNHENVNVTGTVKDSAAVQLTVKTGSGNPFPLEIGLDGSFSSTVNLTEGTNTITISTADAAGNTSAISRLVIRDSQWPIIDITSPLDSIVTSNSTVTVSGTVTDSHLAVLTVAGSLVAVNPDGFYSTQVNLNEGRNNISVVALDRAGNITTLTRFVIRDSQSPMINLTSPVDSLTTDQSDVTVSGMITDSTAVVLTINGNTVSVDAGGVFSYQVPVGEGLNTMTVVATDAAGNTTTVSRRVIRASHALSVNLLSPSDSLVTRQPSIVISGFITDTNPISLTINGIVFPVNPDGSFADTLSISEGENYFTISVDDALNNHIIIKRMIIRDTQPPRINLLSPASENITTDSIIAITGSAYDSLPFQLMVNGNSLSRSSNGTFSCKLQAVMGSNIITVAASDQIGNTSSITRTITRIPPPSDPVKVAPRLNPTVATNMHTATEFLYTGVNPIQIGVTPDTIDPIQVAVLRGKVLTREHQPLPGVKITILDHPEFGYTLSRADGVFDMAANGGGSLTLGYQKDGYLPVQRQVGTNWHDYSIADSVVMISLDTIVTKIDFSEPVQTAKGSIMTDAAGPRQAALSFSQGTKASMVLPDGTTKELNTLHVRATEYTVGSAGRAAMPAILPPNMRYTYCVELSADEAIAENATSVTFDKPVRLFVDNFLNFPVGGIIPVGWYDRQTMAWMPSQNAFVMNVIGLQDSSAIIDLNGDDIADNIFLRDSLHFTESDFQSIAKTYPIGHSFWWTETYHFSSFDCNGQLISIAGGKSPKGNDAKTPKIPCNNPAGGSIIFIQSQVLCETIPLIGTPFHLWYESDRSADKSETLVVGLTGDSLPSGLKRIELYTQIADRSFKQSFQPEPNLITNFKWDGLDAYGRVVSGRQKATFQIAYIYDIDYIIGVLGDSIGHCWTPEQIRSWWDEFQITSIGNTPMFYDNTSVYDSTRSECSFLGPISEEYVGKWTANTSEIGGWTVNVHHTYEPESKTLRRGDGGRVSLEVLLNPTISTIAGSLEQMYLSNIKDPGYGVQPNAGSQLQLNIKSQNQNSLNRQIADDAQPEYGKQSASGKQLQMKVKSQDQNNPNRSSNKYIQMKNGRHNLQKENIRPLKTQSLINSAKLLSSNGVPEPIGWIGSIVVDKDGTIYASDGSAGIYKISNDGSQTRIAGTGEYGFNGLSGVATDIQLDGPTSVKVDDEGNVYFADIWNCRICKVTPDGNLTTIAGTGEPGFSGDGGPAAAAQLYGPMGVAIGPDKNIYISDTYSNIIRCIRPDGIITTVAGIESWGGYDGGDGVPATETTLNNPAGITVDQNGNVFFADVYNNIVRVIRPNGTIETYAGNPYSYGSIGDGMKAIDATLDNPVDIALGKDGALFIADQNNNRIRRVSPGGKITTYAGNGDDYQGVYDGDGTGALSANLGYPLTVAVSPDKSVYIAGSMFARLLKIAPMYPGYTDDTLSIPSEEGNELYTFDSQGRHISTINTLTGTPVYTFEYDTAGRLISITDMDSLNTLIVRDDKGNPVVIIAPFGQRTYCTVDSIGCLASVSNPANETNQMTYSSGGLLKTFRDPKGGLHKFTYDSEGRLIKDEDPAGGYKILTRTVGQHFVDDGTITIQVRTSEGRTATYESRFISEDLGTSYHNTDENGKVTWIFMHPGKREVTQSDGTHVTTLYKPDPRYGMLNPLYDITITTPAGLKTTINQDRIISQMSGLIVDGMTDSYIINGAAYKSIYDGTAKQFTSLSPQGRRSFSWINEKGRVIKDSIPGVDAGYYTYNPQGFLTQVSQGGRASSFTYDTKGLLTSVTDPLGRTVSMEHDSVGRVLKQYLPDNNTINYSYDANSNLSSLTPPGRPAHTFDYTITDLVQNYMPPAINDDTMTTSYQYDRDKMLKRIVRPDNHTIVFNYDSALVDICPICIPPIFVNSPENKTKSIMFDRGELKFDYYGYYGYLSNNLRRIISPSKDTLEYGYDGSLLTSVSRGSTNNQCIKYKYEKNYRVTDQELRVVNTASQIYDMTANYSYDRDGLLTAINLHDQSWNFIAPAMNFTYDPTNGRMTNTYLGNVSTSQSYDSRGALSYYGTDFGGSPIFQTSYERDSLNRISILTEVNQGQTTVKKYAYDIAGRLWQVWRNDTLVSTYSYDPNGNRISHITPTSADSGTYDEQDRMLSYSSTQGLIGSSAQYLYTPNGELKAKIEGTDTTKYVYDDFGNLMSVQFPNGDNIEYLIDGLNRRIGKKINGVIVKRWIYSGQLSPIAEHDSANNITAQFVGNLMIKDGNTYELITDHLGSVRLVVDVNSGTIAQQIDYDEFGNVTQNTNPDLQPFAYSKGLYDSQTKLMRFGARDYDAQIGRWTVKDPILFAGGETSLYGYVGNDPINYIDITGLQTIPNAPRGVDINSNISEARQHPILPLIQGGSFLNNQIILNNNIANLLWFYRKVESGGDWDYKTSGKMYQDFGNFNYGATGAAMGLNDETLLRAAGVYQVWTDIKSFINGLTKLKLTGRIGSGNPLGGPPYGDDPNDQIQIKNGINYSNCK